jgi:tetratricopeptide (TPR) repeat protein
MTAAQQELLQSGVELHRAGQWDAAARLYEQILAETPAHPQALHYLGMLRHQQGNDSQAVELLGRAVLYWPQFSALHANLAEAYRSLGQFDAAIASCQAALALQPDFPEALCNLGLALQESGRLAESLAPLERAIELRSDFAAAHNNLGVSLRALRRGDEALTHFRRAIECDGSLGLARANLGQMLLNRGEPDAAIEQLRAAALLDPQAAIPRHNLGNALRLTDRLSEAREEYLAALEHDPKLAITHAHLGLILQIEGLFGQALARLKRAIELEPRNGAFWEYMAEVCSEMDEPAAAIPCWERALELSPGRPDLHLSLGAALQDEGNLSAAEAQYRTAADLQPASAAAQLRLGGLFEERGEMSAAEAAFRAALTWHPQQPLPHARLATLLRGKLPEPDLAALEQRLTDANLQPGPRARLLFALAHALDARGDYARAAACLGESNALTLQDVRRGQEYQPLEHEHFVDYLMDVFDRKFCDEMQGAGSESRRPVFVFGLPRSGTTLVEQVLASHSEIHGAGELRLARESYEAIPEMLGSDESPRRAMRRLEPSTIGKLAEQHLVALERIDESRALRVIDKMPDNYLYLGLLAAMFPQGTFIYCRRDLRDVAVSCWMTDFRSIRWANDFGHLASRLNQHRRLMSHWTSALTTPIQVVDYEETVADFEGVARRLVAACGLEWQPQCLEFHQTQRPIRTASVTQVRQPLYTRSVERWKHYAEPLSTLFAELREES